jgi:hypothetical protein
LCRWTINDTDTLSIGVYSNFINILSLFFEIVEIFLFFKVQVGLLLVKRILIYLAVFTFIQIHHKRAPNG